MDKPILKNLLYKYKLYNFFTIEDILYILDIYKKNNSIKDIIEIKNTKYSNDLLINQIIDLIEEYLLILEK